MVPPNRSTISSPTLARSTVSYWWKRAVFLAFIIGFCLFSIVDQSSTLSKLTSYFVGEQITMAFRAANIGGRNEGISSRTFVVTTTYYPDLDDIRFHLAIELCKLSQLHKTHLIIVDGSPDHESVAEQFQRAGTAEYVHVHLQDKTEFSGKGGGLRQAIQHATNLIQDSNNQRGNASNDAVICFTEPEKVDMMNHMIEIAKPILGGVTDVVVPTRNDALFKQTYPIEQYHSENFGNLHFDILANQFEGFRREGAEKLDWHFGPFAFKASLAASWLNYEGTSWDAQMIPYVRGVRDENWRILSVMVNFHHRKEMKEQEEGHPDWTKKRLMQLNVLFDLLGDKELSP